jgi:tRNA pseudouridine55 synthase
VDGLLPIDKPAGLTSAALLNRVKRLLPRGTKIGHAGTLDLFATGVLVALVGRGTKRCEEVMGSPKEYETTIKLGCTTPTLDPDTPEVPTPDAAAPDRAAIEATLPKFLGTILQAPPAYSAVKIGGKRASDHARAGAAVAPEPRPVRVDAIELLDYAWPLLKLRVACGRGFYVRALARDIGAALQVGGYLVALRRTKVGDHDVATAATMDALERDGVAAHLKPL